jgi:hypothetical protein
MNQRSCLGNMMFIGHGNFPAMHVLYHLQKTLPFSATKMQTTLHACTLPMKPINAPAIPSNQAYHKSCKRQWLIRRKATYITFLCHEQTSISLKSGTRLPWKDTQGDISRTYHRPWKKPETHSMSSHAYKRKGGGGGGEGKNEAKNTTIGDHHKVTEKAIPTIGDHHKVTVKAIPNHMRPPQGHCKSHPKPLETTTKSPQTPSQTIRNHHKVSARPSS